MYPSKSAVAEHCLSANHAMEYERTKILVQTSRYWDSVVREAIEIRTNDDLINRDCGYNLSKAWEPAIGLIKSKSSKRIVVTTTADRAITPMSSQTPSQSVPPRDRGAGRGRRGERAAGGGYLNRPPLRPNPVAPEQP